jgi:hypothetical protein
VLETQHLCFNAFPDECIGCPEYTETHLDPTMQFALMTANWGLLYPEQLGRKVVKECRLYHKRKIEY